MILSHRCVCHSESDHDAPRVHSSVLDHGRPNIEQLGPKGKEPDCWVCWLDWTRKNRGRPSRLCSALSQKGPMKHGTSTWQASIPGTCTSDPRRTSNVGSSLPRLEGDMDD